MVDKKKELRNVPGKFFKNILFPPKTTKICQGKDIEKHFLIKNTT